MTAETSSIEQIHKEEITWARVVSNLLSPPVVSALMFVPVAIVYSLTPERAFWWSAMYIVLTSIAPTLFIAWGVYRGKITDVHMPIRSERYVPYAVTIACSIGAWLILEQFDATPVLAVVALISIVQIVVMASITFYWQISMHTMAITAAGIAFGVFFGVRYALLMIPFIILVGAARLSLKRHTPAQVVAGAIVGAFVPLAVVWLLILRV